MNVSRKIVKGNQTQKQTLLPQAEHKNKRFILFIHPDEWTFDMNLKKFVPVLSKINLVPGIHNITETLDPSPAINEFTRQGCIILHNLDQRYASLEETGNSYIAEYQCQGNLKAFKEVWYYPDEFRGKITWERDDDLYNAFLEDVLKISPPIKQKAKQYLVERQKKIVQRLEDICASKPSSKPRLEQEKQKLDLMIADLKKSVVKPQRGE